MNKEAILNLLRRKFPEDCAEEWDNTGMLLDSGKDSYDRILVALEMTPDVLKEALEAKADLVVTHHPLIFNPIRKMSALKAQDRMVMDCIKHDLSVFAIHTNGDNYPGGTNDTLADLLGLKEREPLVPMDCAYCKVVVFAPSANAEAIRNRMGDAGGGSIGAYRHCSFSVEGEGRFMPCEDSNPYVGEAGALHVEPEARIETIAPCRVSHDIVEAARSIHPYEEMAYDVIPLKNVEEHIGTGRIGRLSQPVSMKNLLRTLKEILSAEVLRYSGPLDRRIEKIGICTGSGSEYIEEACGRGVDCFLTGDIKYHDAQFARMNGLCLVDIGHYESEDLFKHVLGKMLQEEMDAWGEHAEVMVSKESRNPFEFYR